jgi:hypothetical protein
MASVCLHACYYSTTTSSVHNRRSDERRMCHAPNVKPLSAHVAQPGFITRLFHYCPQKYFRRVIVFISSWRFMG